MKREMLYIAGPYTKLLDGKDKRVERFMALTRAAAEFMADGYLVYSPITHTHEIDLLLADGGTLGSDYWVDFDEHFMAICDRCVVVRLPGWEDSAGVRREVAYFLKHGKTVHFVGPTDYVLCKSRNMQRGLISNTETE
jgi:hypothetical protein